MTPPVDTVDAALEIAGEVLAEYGDDPGATRIERLARFVLLAAGGVGDAEWAVYSVLHDLHVTTNFAQVVIHSGVGVRYVDVSTARTLAAALLHAADLAEAA